MPAVAATNPPVLIGMVAGATERIRVGSGGVMLPNHAPLVVAEQFALLEAAYPGRIDLGIGRAPGTDPVTSWALRHGAGGVTDEAVDPLPGVRRQRARHDGAGRRRARPARAAPTCCRRRPGPGRCRRSGCSAPPTTRPGWPPRRGCPTSSPTTSPARGTAEALELYRATFRPSPELADARARSSPSTPPSRRPARRPSGSPARSCCRWWRCAPAPRSPRSRWSRRRRRSSSPTSHAGLVEAMRERWVIGAPEEAARRAAHAGGDVRRRRGDGQPGRRRLHGDGPRRPPPRGSRRCGCSADSCF